MSALDQLAAFIQTTSFDHPVFRFYHSRIKSDMPVEEASVWIMKILIEENAKLREELIKMHLNQPVKIL